MKTNRLLSVISGFTLAFATLAAPETARGLEVLAPYWAYQLQAGAFLAELRTFSGVTYHNVRIQAINAQQMQFSHSRGVNMEMLTNIVDPNHYLQPGMKVNPPRQGGGRAASREREPAPEPTVGRNGPLAQLMPAPTQVTTGVLKLTHWEQKALITWARSDGSNGTHGLGLEKLTEYEKAQLMHWLSERVAAAQGR